MTTLSPKLEVGNPQSKLALQTANRVVCIDSLWELTSSLHIGTIVDPLGALLPQNWSNQKIKIKQGGKTITDT